MWKAVCALDPIMGNCHAPWTNRKEAAQMVCHVCKEQATARAMNTIGTFAMIILMRAHLKRLRCTSCAENTVVQRHIARAAEQSRINSRTCEFCGAIEQNLSERFLGQQPETAKHKKCAVCSKYFCPRHGTVEVEDGGSREGYNGSYRANNVWVRCHLHPRRKGSFFKQGDPPDIIREA